MRGVFVKDKVNEKITNSIFSQLQFLLSLYQFICLSVINGSIHFLSLYYIFIKENYYSSFFGINYLILTVDTGIEFLKHL